ncbi:MAG TPA: hypothetical protein VMS88_06760 [Terriglobales bacterium]|nr:hypothetical protein [Terriglobales bacterium]
MIRSRHVLALIAALLGVVSLAHPARPAVAPDSVQRAALDTRLRRLSRVQVVTEDSSFILPKPAARADGLFMREPWRPPRRALIEIDVPPPPAPPALVPWSEIAKVQAPTNDFRTGAIAGAVVGTAMVGASIYSFRHYLRADWRDYSPAVWVGAPLLIGASALAGGVLFGTGETGWRTVYPPKRR